MRILISSIALSHPSLSRNHERAVEPGGTPFVIAGSVAGSLTALERLRALGAETIVPGHGSVCGPEVIDDMAAYLRFVQELARKSFESGLVLPEAARGADLGRFAGRHDAERSRLVGTCTGPTRRSKASLWARPWTSRPMIADMIAYNSGRPVRCLA